MIFPPRTAELLARCAFAPPGSGIACAVSGGTDSLGLLALAVAAGGDVTAYHVDHGLRDGSASEAEVVGAAAAQLGARFVSLRVEVAPGPNLEARARAARAAELPKNVATGHTMDDQAETVLLNLLRGAGVDGLAAMRAGARHPLLALRRVELAELVAQLGFDHVVDPSNSDTRFLRNRVRHELMPLLVDLARRDVVPVLARQADLLGEESDLLESLASNVDASDLVALRTAPLGIRRRVLRRFARSATGSPYSPDAAAIARLLEVVAGERLATELPGGARVTRSAGRLVVAPRRSPAR